MDINMEELLLSGVHGDYKFRAIKLLLKLGEVEIGPPHRNRSSEDGATDVVLQVYNEFAHEVEIEYQPAIYQEDTQWRFVCDGRVLKTVVPYKFWKTYLYSSGEDGHPGPEDGDPRPNSSNPSTSARSSETTVLEHNAYLVAEQKQGFQAPPSSPLLEVHTRNRQVSTQQDARPVFKVLESNQSAFPDQGDVTHTSPTSFVEAYSQLLFGFPIPHVPGTHKNLEAAKKNKLNCAKTISPVNREISEKEFKVQCTRPASPWNLAKDVSVYSPVETYERVIKVKCYRPNSPEDLSRGRLQESRRSSMPCPSIEEFLKGKLDLQGDRLALVDRKIDTGLQPLRQIYSRETVDRAASSPSSDTWGVDSRQISGRSSRGRATIDAATSPIPTPRKFGPSLNSIPYNTLTDSHTRPPDRGSLLGYSQNYNILTVGKILLKDKHEVGPINLWRRKCDWISTETVNLFRQGKSSGDVLKGVLEYIAKEKQILVKRGKKYFNAKKRGWNRLSVENIFCACFDPNCRKIDEIDLVARKDASVKLVLEPTRTRIWMCISGQGVN